MDVHRFADPDFILRLQGLLESNRLDEFFDLVYKAFAEDPDGAVREIVSSPEKAKTRIADVRSMLQRFVDAEEYEKCALLQRIIDSAEGLLNK